MVDKRRRKASGPQRNALGTPSYNDRQPSEDCRGCRLPTGKRLVGQDWQAERRLDVEIEFGDFRQGAI